MPVYHSRFTDGDAKGTCSGIPLLPIASTSGQQTPAQQQPGAGDIVDEAIELFRANSLFRSFDVQNSADKLLIYLTLFLNQCLRRESPTCFSTEARADVTVFQSVTAAKARCNASIRS